MYKYEIYVLFVVIFNVKHVYIYIYLWLYTMSIILNMYYFIINVI